MKNKILFCWSDISGYMAACWKALVATQEVDLQIIAFGNNTATSFSHDITDGLQVHYVSRTPSINEIETYVRDFNPDTIVVAGWFVKAYRKLVWNKEITAQFILAMDTPWWGRPKQYFTKFLLRGYFKRIQAVLTCGERSFQYAQRLTKAPIFKMQYGVDAENLGKAYHERLKTNWPESFLFVGRYSKEKGIDTMVNAYSKYRKSTSSPWSLQTCGQGDLKGILHINGVMDHGFVQPYDMPAIWENAGCLVLAANFDPWPLIVVEACAAGLPVIVTHESGSQVEVVKMFYNGLVIHAEDVNALTEAMLWIQKYKNSLPEMGKRSVSQAAPYDAKIWAIKFNHMLKALDK